MKLTFLGQSAFLLEGGGTTVLVDPFLTGNPVAERGPADVQPDVIVLTHGHADHYGDTVDIAKRTGAQVVAIVEIANELSGKGLENVADPNLGGTVAFAGGWVRFVPAWHTSTTPDGQVATPAGVVLSLDGKVVYHLGDTALFSDLALPGRRDRLDAAIVPIGGHYTMDRHDAVEAARLVGAPKVIPCHFDTFPPIETDAEAFKSDVEGAGIAQVSVLAPGASEEL